MKVCSDSWTIGSINSAGMVRHTEAPKHFVRPLKTSNGFTQILTKSFPFIEQCNWHRICLFRHFDGLMPADDDYFQWLLEVAWRQVAVLFWWAWCFTNLSRQKDTKRLSTCRNARMNIKAFREASLFYVIWQNISSWDSQLSELQFINWESNFAYLLLAFDSLSAYSLLIAESSQNE